MVHELMTSLARALVGLLRARAALLAENALLRQQVIVLERAAPLVVLSVAHPWMRTPEP